MGREVEVLLKDIYREGNRIGSVSGGWRGGWGKGGGEV